MNKVRLAFFGSSSSIISSIIYKALLEQLKYRKDIELVAVINTVEDGKWTRLMRQDFVTTLLRWLVLRVQGHKFTWRYYGRIKGTRIKDINSAQCYRILNINHVDAILSVACPQIFGDVLLGYYYCVNYHNSLLPLYRGVCATQWECYLNETRQGYTFHRMVKGIDSGNVLIQGNIGKQPPLSYNDVIERDCIKATRAGKYSLGTLLTFITENYEGTKQKGKSTYFPREELKQLNIGEEEIKCFGWTAFPYHYIPKWLRWCLK